MKIFSSKQEQIFRFNTLVSIPEKLESLQQRLNELYESNTAHLQVGKTDKRITFRQLSKKKTYSVTDEESFKLIKSKLETNSADFDVVCK